MIFLNYKTYENGTGEKALFMSKIVEDVSRASGIKIIPAVQALDIKEITSNVSIEVWSQK